MRTLRLFPIFRCICSDGSTVRDRWTKFCLTYMPDVIHSLYSNHCSRNIPEIYNYKELQEKHRDCGNILNPFNHKTTKSMNLSIDERIAEDRDGQKTFSNRLYNHASPADFRLRSYSKHKRCSSVIIDISPWFLLSTPLRFLQRFAFMLIV